MKSAKRISKGRNEITTSEVLECAKAACSDVEEVENARDKRIKIATHSKGVALADTEWIRIFNMTLKYLTGINF